MISEIDKLKHFHICKYVKNKHLITVLELLKMEKLLYLKMVDLLVILVLVKKLWKKYTEAIYKYRTNTGKMTASDYTHLFGYLNPYYRSAYNIPKRRK